MKNFGREGGINAQGYEFCNALPKDPGHGDRNQTTQVKKGKEGRAGGITM